MIHGRAEIAAGVVRTVVLALAVAFGSITCAKGQAPPAGADRDALPSWRDGAAKRSITEFVSRVAEGGSDHVPPSDRIAVFDNDGTLWSEQPLYFQFLFALDRVRAMAPEHPEWRNREPFASILRGDTEGALAGGEHAIAEIVVATHAGMTTEAFDAAAREWLATAKHPTKGRPYTEMV